MSNIKSITAKPLSGAVLAAFFDGADAKAAAQGVAKAEQSRMEFLKGSLAVSDFTTVREAIKDYNTAAVKMHGEKSSGSLSPSATAFSPLVIPATYATSNQI